MSGQSEIALCVRRQLRVGRMIHRFETDHMRLEAAGVLVEIPQELKLGGGWADDQDLLCPCESLDHVLKEATCIIGMIVLRGRPFGMAVNMVPWRMTRGYFDLTGLDPEDPCFLMIHPHHEMLRAHAPNRSKSRARRLASLMLAGLYRPRPR